MPRRPDRFRLDTLHLPASVARLGREAAREAITAHVHAFLSAYRGDIYELAMGCYVQGLLDAAHMAQEYPGWPEMPKQDETG